MNNTDNIEEEFDRDYPDEVPQPDHQEICPDCGKLADVFFIGNGPDDYYSRLVCPYCGLDIQD